MPKAIRLFLISYLVLSVQAFAWAFPSGFTGRVCGNIASSVQQVSGMQVSFKIQNAMGWNGISGAIEAIGNLLLANGGTALQVSLTQTDDPALYPVVTDSHSFGKMVCLDGVYVGTSPDVFYSQKPTTQPPLIGVPMGDVTQTFGNGAELFGYLCGNVSDLNETQISLARGTADFWSAGTGHYIVGLEGSGIASVGNGSTTIIGVSSSMISTLRVGQNVCYRGLFVHPKTVGAQGSDDLFYVQ